jgi:hypothetical protein
MKVANAVAEILKREGTVSDRLRSTRSRGRGRADIRTIMVRQSGSGCMRDAIAKASRRPHRRLCDAAWPGTRTPLAAVAQPGRRRRRAAGRPARNINQVRPNFNAALNYRNSPNGASR